MSREDDEFTNANRGEFDLVYNMLSLAIAAMFGSFVFFVIAQPGCAQISACVDVVVGRWHRRLLLANLQQLGRRYVLAEGMYKPGVPFNNLPVCR